MHVFGCYITVAWLRRRELRHMLWVTWSHDMCREQYFVKSTPLMLHTNEKKDFLELVSMHISIKFPFTVLINPTRETFTHHYLGESTQLFSAPTNPCWTTSRTIPNVIGQRVWHYTQTAETELGLPALKLGNATSRPKDPDQLGWLVNIPLNMYKYLTPSHSPFFRFYLPPYKWMYPLLSRFS
jgi:hypothetical protein